MSIEVWKHRHLLLDSIREWTPPMILIMVAITVTLGVVSILLHWSPIPSNAAMITTALCMHAQHKARCSRKNLEKLFTAAVEGTYRQQVDGRA